MQTISEDKKDNKSISLLGRVFLVIAGLLIALPIIFFGVYLITFIALIGTIHDAPNRLHLLFFGFIQIVIATISWIAILLTAYSGKFNRVWIQSLVIPIVIYGVSLVLFLNSS